MPSVEILVQTEPTLLLTRLEIFSSSAEPSGRNPDDLMFVSPPRLSQIARAASGKGRGDSPRRERAVWRSLMDAEPDAQISPELSLVIHRLGTVRAAVDVMDGAINMYVTLLVLTEDIRRTGMEPGSTLDQLERLRDEFDKLWARGDAPSAWARTYVCPR